MSVRLTFGERLSDLRISRGLTQAELAEKIGTHASTIGHYETNRNPPVRENLVKLADFFGVSQEYLLGKVDYNVRDATLDSVYTRRHGKPVTLGAFVELLTRLDAPSRADAYETISALIKGGKLTFKK